MPFTKNLSENEQYLKNRLPIDKSFDLIFRQITIGGRDSFYICIDGLSKDETILRIFQSIQGEKTFETLTSLHRFLKANIGYLECDMTDNADDVVRMVLSGAMFLMIDGFSSGIILDTRTYPTRSPEEPALEKVTRGARDGLVETIVFNTALIRRRIRDPRLIMEILSAGESSHTDIAVCYMDGRVDENLLKGVKKRIQQLHADALTMNQESLAEGIYPYKWYNPFPKFKFSERPDTAAACILEGNIVILVDNSPAAMVLPSSVFDIIEEADDYYFPPITGTYLRLSRMLTAVLSLFLTPTWLLMMMHPEALPDWLEFTKLADQTYVPLIFQLLILEFAIDGLRLAAINTPNMLTTPLSVIAGIVLGEYSVKSGWFNSETMLYMAFVTIANYSQSSFELGYALKFMRVMILIFTSIFDVWGYGVGVVLSICAVVFNKTIAGKSYIYPLIPFQWNEVKKRFFRGRLPMEKKDA